MPEPEEIVPPSKGEEARLVPSTQEVLRGLSGLSHKERAKVLGKFGRKDSPKELAISQFVSATMWQGPLPSPEHLERFNRVVSGSAERLIRMAEKQQDHRMGLEKKVSSSQTRQSALGQIFALVICLAILGVGAFAISKGFPAAGATIVTGTIVGMAYVFITGKREEQVSRRNKRQAIEESESEQASQQSPAAGSASGIDI